MALDATTTTAPTEATAAQATPRLSGDFWKFFTGQTISNLGSTVTIFVLPLLIYRLTGSALNLGLATSLNFLPYLLFGLVIGAWVDRVDRRRLMIAVDCGRAVLIASIPVLFALDRLPLWWIYATGFLTTTLTIAFTSAEFAAIPSLVAGGDLVTANGRIQASYSAASVLGPLLAGPLLAVASPATVLTIDAATFVVSALTLASIRRSFNTSAAQPGGRGFAELRRDIVEGLRYVIGHPVLRAISIMMALINFVASTQAAQLIFFAKERLGASDARVSILFSAGSVGVVLLSLAAGPLRRRWSFSRVALGALMLNGLLTVAMAFLRDYWLVIPLWALISGLAVLFNINTGSLRQAIVPNDLLGRVMSVAMVLAFSAIPLGTFVGGVLIEWSGNIAAVYAGIGVVTAAIAFGFSFTALGEAERYLPEKEGD
jgi:MFS family permease